MPGTLRKVGRVLKSRVRLLIVVAGVLVIFAFALWWLGAAWFEPPVDPLISLRGLWLRDMRTVVTLDSLDPDTSTVVAHVSTNFDDAALFLFDPDVRRQIPAMGSLKEVPPSSEYTIYYQRPEIQDLSPIFNLMGLRLIRQEAFAPEFDRVKQSLLSEAPRDSDSVLSVIGEPRMYPFDRYMILFQMRAGAFLEFDKKIARVDSGYNVIPRLPGFVVREISGNELRGWEGPVGKQMDALGGKNPAYNPSFWIDSGVSLSAERPLFLRVLTVVLGIIALISVILASLVSDPSKYLLNSLATFAALWGVRSIIAAGAPKTPNLVDFAVLALFILQIGLVTARFLVSHRSEPKIIR